MVHVELLRVVQDEVVVRGEPDAAGQCVLEADRGLLDGLVDEDFLPGVAAVAVGVDPVLELGLSIAA
ncbi:hypothetical protein ACFVSN_30845 [Kitasatospora sp. NPDC057904]|uniref:hypothetical protein n=1 Tax=Kitasatospora sp. NPDC057904 TaxID=3346275 RepID=UPI0036D92D06